MSRYQAFVPTKALSHLHEGLENFSKSLSDHGHPQPILGFTDNVASDAATFIQCLPSLGKGVTSVNIDDHPELARMVLPPDVSVLTCSSEAAIRSACDIILANMPDEPGVMYVEFDME